MITWLKAWRKRVNQRRLAKLRMQRARLDEHLALLQMQCLLFNFNLDRLEVMRLMREGIKICDDLIESLEA